LATKSGSLDTMKPRLPQEEEDSISQSFSAIRRLTRDTRHYVLKNSRSINSLYLQPSRVHSGYVLI
jgi:hypothetical protein